MFEMINLSHSTPMQVDGSGENAEQHFEKEQNHTWNLDLAVGKNKEITAGNLPTNVGSQI